MAWYDMIPGYRRSRSVKVLTPADVEDLKPTTDFLQGDYQDFHSHPA